VKTLGISNSNEPSVAILLATMNGQNFLSEQLDSIESQAHAKWTIWASDDGSIDGTRTILRQYQCRLGVDKLTVLEGPGRGFVNNFLSLACNSSIQSDFYAFADQDDVWQADKLTRALDWFKTAPCDLPILYCARTLTVNENNQITGMSPLFSKPSSFANALVQNIGGGNTMVFNYRACELLRIAGADVRVASHDWWAYLIVTGCGGIVHYDPIPTVHYRQHGGNILGSNNNLASKWTRIKMLFQGGFKEWMEKNKTALGVMQEKLTLESASRLAEFERVGQGHVLSRLLSLKRSGVYRQTFFGNLGLVVAVVFNKL